LYFVERESYWTKAEGGATASGFSGSAKSKLLASKGGPDSEKLVG
jgi:hypothetical protein